MNKKVNVFLENNDAFFIDFLESLYGINEQLFLPQMSFITEGRAKQAAIRNLNYTFEVSYLILNNSPEVFIY